MYISAKNIFTCFNYLTVVRNTLYQSFGDGPENLILLWKLVDKMKGASLLVTGGYDMDRMPYFKSAMQDYFIQLQPNVWGLKDYKEPQTKWYKQVFRVFNK